MVPARAVAAVALLLAGPFAVVVADAPAGVLQRYDFSDGLDGWQAVSGSVRTRAWSVVEVLEVAGRARSPALPEERPIRVVASVTPSNFARTSLDLVDDAGTLLGGFYTTPGACWIHRAAAPALKVPQCYANGWLRVEFELAADGYAVRVDGRDPVASAYVAPGAPVAVDAASTSGTLNVDVLRVERGPRVDDGLLDAAALDVFELVDTRPDDGGFGYEADPGFTDDGFVATPDTWPRLPQQEFAAAPAPAGPFVVQTAFSLANALFTPDGAAIVAGLPAGAGPASPLWAVTVEAAVETPTRVAFVAPDGTTRTLVAPPDVAWHAVLVHVADGRVRVFFDEALVADEPGAHPGRVAMGDVFDGLVPGVQRTGGDYRILLDGGVPLPLADPAAAP